MTTHANNANIFGNLEPSAEGATTLTTINISNLAATQLTLSVTNASGVNWVIKSATYSYDGVIHTDSYISDI
jgi:hypothetical protein